MTLAAPALYTLVADQVSIPGGFIGQWFDSLEGLDAVAAQFRLEYGGGGTMIQCYLQTSLDDGQTAFDIACVTFGSASKTVLLNLTAASVLVPVVPTDSALPNDTVINGLLGPRLRVRYISTGTYTQSTVLSVRAHVR